MFWLVEHEDGDFSKHEAVPGTEGIPLGVRWVCLPRDMDLGTEKWDWEQERIVPKASPQQARDKQWQKTKDYRAFRMATPLPIPNVVEGAVIVADTDPESAAIVDRLARGAMAAMMVQAPFTLTFTDFTNTQYTVSASQVIEIGNAVLIYHSVCHKASQVVRDLLDAALTEEKTCEEILAIDVEQEFQVAFMAALPV